MANAGSLAALRFQPLPMPAPPPLLPPRPLLGLEPFPPPPHVHALRLWLRLQLDWLQHQPPPRLHAARLFLLRTFPRRVPAWFRYFLRSRTKTKAAPPAIK